MLHQCQILVQNKIQNRNDLDTKIKNDPIKLFKFIEEFSLKKFPNLYQQELIIMEYYPGPIFRKNTWWIKEQKMTWKISFYLTTNLQ